jgi:hypothetical protein
VTCGVQALEAAPPKSAAACVAPNLAAKMRCGWIRPDLDTCGCGWWGVRQSFLGNAGTQFPELIGLVDTSISLVCNLLFLIAIVYAFAAMALIIFPQSSLKVHAPALLKVHGIKTASRSLPKGETQQ